MINLLARSNAILKNSHVYETILLPALQIDFFMFFLLSFTHGIIFWQMPKLLYLAYYIKKLIIN